MNLMSDKRHKMVSFLVVVAMIGSLSISAFAQDGIVALENRVSPAQKNKARTVANKKAPAKAVNHEETEKSKVAETATVSDEPKAEKAEVVTTAPAISTETQDPQTQNPITQPLALSPEIGTQRVGVREDLKQVLALQEAIAMALQNNLDIEQNRQTVKISQYNLFASYGVYDIATIADINFRSQTFPVANIFQGGNANASLTQKILTYNFTTEKFLEKGGGLYQINFNNTRTNTSSTAATLTTQYNPSLSLTFTQPLMRNFKIDANRRAIQINKKQLDLSDSQFRQRVIEIINSVQRAYWDLVFAIRNEKIARETVELTRTQLLNNQKQVEAGTLAPIELRSTEAALESRKGDVITAMQTITTSENTLKGLLMKDPNDKMWDAQIVPTDDPSLNPLTFNFQESQNLALKNRPELEQLRLQSQQKEIDLKYYNNQLKPQINLVGTYSNTGLAGAPSAIATQNGVTVPDRFVGGYFSALRNLFSQDFRTYQVGVSINFPWRNRTVEANIGRTMAESAQLDARQRQTVQNIQIEVRNALQAVESARQRFEAQRANRIAADAQLKGEEEKFRAGLSTNFFVLQRQTDLSVARGNEIRALTDYNKALADLQRVTGISLVSNNVQVTAIENTKR
ncbi:MAG: TolC family protein [Acidobacteriota bacterium]